MKKVSIIDYGMGNTQSLYNALRFLGYLPKFYSENKEIDTNFCILPGVGAYNHAMKLLKKKQIDKKIYTFLENKNNIILGICLGMQLFFNESEENFNTEGLNIINGKVSKLSSKESKILPNVGWFNTNIESNDQHSYLRKFNNEKFYYVHTYHAKPDNESNQIGTSDYYEEKFCAITVRNSNIIGTQFHPEKSSNVGLEFLSSIITNSVN